MCGTFSLHETVYVFKNHSCVKNDLIKTWLNNSYRYNFELLLKFLFLNASDDSFKVHLRSIEELKYLK